MRALFAPAIVIVIGAAASAHAGNTELSIGS